MKKCAVVFDFGGVMTTSTMPRRVQEVAKANNIPWEAILAGFAKYRHAYDAGNISLIDLYKNTWRDAALDVSDELTAKIIEADRASWLYRNERTRDWMRKLKAEGRKIGILTNMAPDFAPLFKEHFADFIEIADAMVISGLEHMHKPNRDIYDLEQARMNLEPGRLIFIDDVEENCVGARAAGWKAIRFVSNDQVESDFAKLIAEEEV